MNDRAPLSRIDPDRIYARLEAAGNAWADTDAAATLLEETRKPLLARLTLEHQRGDRVSHAQALTAALAEPEYRAHLESMVEARRVALRARVGWDAARMWVEMARSANANQRAVLTAAPLSA